MYDYKKSPWPKWRYHKELCPKGLIVWSEEENNKLGDDWQDSYELGAFDPKPEPLPEEVQSHVEPEPQAHAEPEHESQEVKSEEPKQEEPKPETFSGKKKKKR